MMEKGAKRTCRGTTDSGQPCQSPLVGKDGWCDAHRPGGREEMKRRGRKGGEAKANGTGLARGDLGPLETSADAERWCQVIALAVAEGTISTGRGNALRKCVKEFRQARADRLTEEKLNLLETKVRELDEAGRLG